MTHPVTEGGATDSFDYVHELWTRCLDPSVEFERKLDRLLTSESDRFDLPYGFFTHVDAAEDTQEIVRAHGSHELLQPGQTCPLSKSYCRKTIAQADGRLRVNEALSDGWGDDPAYEVFELGSYVGSTVETTDGIYGTLCFASSNPRDEPIADREALLVDMFAQWVSYELVTRERPTRSADRPEQLRNVAELAAHDLRNPLSVASSQLALLQEGVQDAVDRIDAAHARMEHIIDDLNLLARLDEPVTAPECVDLRTCVSAAWEMVQTEEATLAVELDGATVSGDPSRLTRLFENLFHNAIHHGSSAATVRVGTLADGFYVEDDGPGIPPDERELVLSPGYSTTPDGTGFGLSIVRQIVDAHDWTLTITAGDSGGARFEVTGASTG
ncbi:histidine kinase [Salinigranum rubrum]|uniref:histidine kinase n=1 Tax=Salinigranum rubrum TaxID=755307 RepID=A0A2I8VHR7_9EURY|nr:HAMP domain-containing sensor histidine kinase [Salinigranum rubrum]AUV81477.1 histidine kinase [Salinigranum rubrum]